jgi:hypothetical protein
MKHLTIDKYDKIFSLSFLSEGVENDKTTLSGKAKV